MGLVTKRGCLYIQDIRPQAVLQRHARWEDTEPTAADIAVKGWVFFNIEINFISKSMLQC